MLIIIFQLIYIFKIPWLSFPDIEGNYRMLVNDTDGTTSSYCDVTPPTYEYHFMVKNGEN